MFFIAATIMGGREAVAAVEGEGVAQMCDVIKLEKMNATPVGDDILVEAYVVKE